MNPEKLAAHLQVDHYGDYWLTEAIRPSLDLQIVPREGFRVGVYRDAKASLEVPVLIAAISRDKYPLLLIYESEENHCARPSDSMCA